MGKKRTAGIRPQHSFKELILQAVEQKVKPLIDSAVGPHFMQIQQLIQSLMQNQASTQPRLLVLEDLVKKQLKISDKAFGQLLLEKEDELLGLKTVKEAKKGDFLRLRLTDSENSEPIFYSIQKLGEAEVSDLPVKNQIPLVGCKVGDKKELLFEAGKEKKTLTATVERISREVTGENKQQRP